MIGSFRIPLPSGAAFQCQAIPADYGAQMVAFKFGMLALIAAGLVIYKLWRLA